MNGPELLHLLVQYRELPKALPLFNPELLRSDQVQAWRAAADIVCGEQNFNAVAFNQLPTELLNDLGFSYAPQIIYFKKKSLPEIDSLNDTLVVNPQVVRLGSVQKEWNISLERCGSITDRDGIRPLMFVLRPNEVKVDAYLWHPGQTRLTRQQFHLVGDYASVMDHEAHHLGGNTALTYLPIRLLDFTDPNIWSYFLGRVGRNTIVLPENDRYLINRNGKTLVVNISGEQVSELWA